MGLEQRLVESIPQYVLAAVTITITIITFAPLFPYHEPSGEVGPGRPL